MFPLCVLFVFLVLAAQYESLTLPLAIILIVPMCLLAAIAGVLLDHGDNNIFTQVGLIVLVGLACKNAILIVEFAKHLQEEQGHDAVSAVLEAARMRLRPILMTSFAFIMGVVPLMVAGGAGAEIRHALGTTVFAGMLGVTFFGLLLTPVFYVLVRRLTGAKQGRGNRPSASDRRAGGPPCLVLPERQPCRKRTVSRGVALAIAAASSRLRRRPELQTARHPVSHSSSRAPRPAPTPRRKTRKCAVLDAVRR